MKMHPSFALLILPLILMSCNAFEGLSNPSNDAQYLDAARSCLDHGDYDCALKNYEALSSAYTDTQISEESLTTLAQYGIFSISDLVASLGTNVGSATSYAILADALANRGVTTATDRTITKQVYDNDTKIIDNTKLAAFAKFLASLAMFNEVLATAVGSDGVLTADDLVANPTTCKSSSGLNSVACAAPSGTSLIYNSSDNSDFATYGNTGNGDWSGAASIQKLIISADEVTTNFLKFADSSASKGLVQTAQTLSALKTADHTSGAVAEGIVRFGLITALDL